MVLQHFVGSVVCLFLSRFALLNIKSYTLEARNKTKKFARRSRAMEKKQKINLERQNMACVKF